MKAIWKPFHFFFVRKKEDKADFSAQNRPGRGRARKRQLERRGDGPGFAAAATPPPSQPEVGGWSGSQAGEAGPGAASRLWTVGMGHPTEGWGSGDCEAPRRGAAHPRLCPGPPSLKEPPTPEPSSRPLQGFRALGVQWRGGGPGVGNEVGEDPSRRVSQTTGCFQKALEGSWKGQRGQSSGRESRHQGRDGRPGARGQRDTDTLPPSQPTPKSTLGLCFRSVLLSKHIQLYTSTVSQFKYCVCVPRIPAPPLPPQSPPSSKPLHLPPVHSTCPPHWPLPSWPALPTALRSCRNPAKPCQSLCLSYSDPSPAPQFSPVSAPPPPTSVVCISVSTPVSISTALPLSQPLSCSDRPTSGLGTGYSRCWMPFPQISTRLCLASFRALLKWHLPRDAAWNGPT